MMLPTAAIRPHVDAVPIGQIAARYGITKRAVHRWLAREAVSTHVADRLAIAVGLHPGEVWAEWWSAEETAEVDPGGS